MSTADVPRTDAQDWMSRVAGRLVRPPARRSFEDLQRTRGFLRPDPDRIPVPEGVEHVGDVVLAERPGWRLHADVWAPVTGGGLPTVLHLHGGGYCGGSGSEEARTAALLAGEGFVVVCPSYALAPERPFPAALEDALAAYRWLQEHPDLLRIDPSRVVLSGGSAGAALAAAACLELVSDRPGTTIVGPRGLVLFYGMLDLGRSLQPDQDPSGLHRLWARAYLGDRLDERLDDPRVSPGRSERLELLPPTYVSCGACDRLLPQSLDMIGRLAAAGVDVTGSVVAGSDHAFAKYLTMSPAERAEMARVAAWMHEPGSRVGEARVP